MQTARADTLPIRVPDDVVRVRQEVRLRAVEIGLSLVEQTKMVTAASELARNTLEYGRGGDCRMEILIAGGRRGLRLTFEDQGPGISDVAQALTDGWTSGKGLGLGLSGARRLCEEFDIVSEPGQGTKVTVARWK